ncbi:MAG: AtpZ/AtpI family protein [Magnetococcales bacterium]|nr:AtpZ/AtpI family protein [Magnetococcales bacterium]MBF0438951.1 AtpZ/AtpI family protein [Magnetococcales bacterium]
MRMSSDLVAAIFVGGGIGYLLDYWCGTQPWLTLVFFLLGVVTGFRNLYRLSLTASPQGGLQENNGVNKRSGHHKEPPL